MEVLEGLIGQDRARVWLRAGLTTGELAQTLIFVGPLGVGRRTAALAVAQYLHKSDRVNHPDTFWFGEVLAGMRQQKKDNPVRSTVDELLKFLQMSPFSSQYKVAILDEVEDLNDIAQNALLKTLEEPRENVLIILLAQKEAQLLPTILSRSQIVRFNPLTESDLRRLVPEAEEVILGFAMGSAGIAKRLISDNDFLELTKELGDFWEKVEEKSVIDRFAMVEKVADRDMAMWFLRVGLAVWHKRLYEQPDVVVSERLSKLGETLARLGANVNVKLALEALLLVF